MMRVNYRVFFVLIFASLTLFWTDRKEVLYWPRYGVQVVVNPIQYGLYAVRIGFFDAISFLTFWRSGEERIKNLEQKNWELTSKLVSLETLTKENQALREQLGTNPISERKLFLARVLGKGQGMEVDIGSRQGVKVGMTVVYAGNLVGRVEKVLPHAAFVTLPTDGNSKIPVAIGQVRAVAVGSFGSQILLDKVGQTDLIQKDDLVRTSGEGDSFLPDLIVGRVSKISGKETDLFRQAEVTPLLDYGKIETVFVVNE